MSSSDTVRKIREKVRGGRYRLYLHAEKERHADRILISELEETVKTLELIEDYPDDPRGPSGLFLGFTRK